MFGPAGDGGYPSRQCDVSSVYDFAGSDEDQAAFAYPEAQKFADAAAIATEHNTFAALLEVARAAEACISECEQGFHDLVTDDALRAALAALEEAAR